VWLRVGIVLYLGTSLRLFTGRDAEKRSHATGHCVIDVENSFTLIMALPVILGELTLPVTKKGYENLISWA
jgi:hypothetical protein